MSAYLQLGSAVVFNVAAYLVYKGIAGSGPRIWWPMFAVGLMLGAADDRHRARHAVMPTPGVIPSAARDLSCGRKGPSLRSG
jgi:hypothetical protein